MGAPVTTSSKAPTVGAIAAATVVLMLAAFVSVLAVVIEASTCGGADHESAPSAQARQAIPADYLALYRAAGHDYEVPWPILAGIGDRDRPRPLPRSRRALEQ